mmetsp:Transcript_59553/g.98745  ORF Transcript_59553/g.98745 Transcript_59553/m.98745 type:complete len:535 (+) Transcript_59553:95-1699(+)
MRRKAESLLRLFIRNRSAARQAREEAALLRLQVGLLKAELAQADSELGALSNREIMRRSRTGSMTMAELSQEMSRAHEQFQRDVMKGAGSAEEKLSQLEEEASVNMVFCQIHESRSFRNTTRKQRSRTQLTMSAEVDKDKAAIIIQTHVRGRNVRRSVTKDANASRGIGFHVIRWRMQYKRAVCFWFVDADHLRTAGYSRLPEFKVLLRTGALQLKWFLLDDRGFIRTDQLDGLERFCVISHRWEALNQPDPAGVQMDQLRKILGEHTDIKWVWFDYGCAPQKPRTRFEDKLFQLTLNNIWLLFLHLRVVILLDLSYLSRFWTSYEAWLSMRTYIHGDGQLAPTIHLSNVRYLIVPLRSNPGHLFSRLLVSMWANCSLEEAIQILQAPDVSLTNGKDKQLCVEKMRFAFSHGFGDMSTRAKSCNSTRANLMDGPTQLIDKEPTKAPPLLIKALPIERGQSEPAPSIKTAPQKGSIWPIKSVAHAFNSSGDFNDFTAFQHFALTGKVFPIYDPMRDAPISTHTRDAPISVRRVKS